MEDCGKGLAKLKIHNTHCFCNVRHLIIGEVGYTGCTRFAIGIPVLAAPIHFLVSRPPWPSQGHGGADEPVVNWEPLLRLLEDGCNICLFPLHREPGAMTFQIWYRAVSSDMSQLPQHPWVNPRCHRLICASVLPNYIPLFHRSVIPQTLLGGSGTQG